MAQYQIMVPVPEVEPQVARLRALYDPSARRGLGAHVTIVHANLPPERLDPMALERIGMAVSPLTPFDYRITRVARFPGTLYLAAEPVAPFALLRERLRTALGERERPEAPLIPHVSVVRKSAIDDRAVEAELSTMLERHAPIPCRCQHIVLLENSSGGWRPVREFVLNGDTGNPSRATS
jgi:hypothetical protein